MTLPLERTRSIRYTREFLYLLLDPKQTPRVPRPIRRMALDCLRHYPNYADLQVSARRTPEVWGWPEK